MRGFVHFVRMSVFGEQSREWPADFSPGSWTVRIVIGSVRRLMPVLRRKDLALRVGLSF